MTGAEVINIFLHSAILLLCAPLSLGIITRVKALFAGRTGAPLLQVYYDLAKLFRKGVVVSETATWVFLASPLVGLITVFVAALLVPMGPLPACFGFTGDPILLAYLLGLGRFFTTLAAMDTGSSFEGMGAARESTFACLGEPVLFFALLALFRLTGSFEVGNMLGAPLARAWSGYAPTMVLTSVSLFVLLLAENCRIPFDDPNTHLELTMIHEVMVLDHSGPLLGLVLYGAAIKLFLFEALILGVVAPIHTGNVYLDLLLFTAGILVVSALVGVVESAMARLRLTRVPNLLATSGVLCSFGFLLLWR